MGRVLANISGRGTLFAIIVNISNEEHRSLTLNILYGQPQGTYQCNLSQFYK